MSIKAFRIGRTEYAPSFFDGEGPFKYGGRWNSQGTRMVYTSESLALATLEIVVHFDAEQVRNSYSYAAVTIGQEYILPVETFTELPGTWRDAPAPLQVQEIGDRWVRSGVSAVLKVPTAVLPEGYNYLINIEHPDFSKLECGVPKLLSLDERLLN
ncbi:MAG: RES family NAD+ phosphorylase [Acidobacteriota bacterium]|nr:RES family NAD+ phosphorylase [Acidobacteriota bacterium]MDH3528362.1 RES family NAD+ phosphorylase [Acidobacteriota bacterium]